MNNTFFFFSLILLIGVTCSSNKNTILISTPTLVNTENEPSQGTPIPSEQLAKAKAIIVDVTEEDINNVKAKNKYDMLCAMCHGMDGKLQFNGAKDLSESVYGLEENVALIYYGKGFMSPYNGMMTEAEIVAVAKYLKTELKKVK